MTARGLLLAAVLWLSGCGRYSDFKLPPPSSAPAPATLEWIPRPAPVLPHGAPGEWDSHDALNPSVVVFHRSYLNLYSGFDGKTWATGLAISNDGIQWIKQGKVLGPDPNTWEGDAMAANGAVIENAGRLMYFYQAGKQSQIGVAFSSDGRSWTKHPAPVLGAGPRGSWDERGVGDPYAIRAAGKLYLFYLGMDRARRQRLGIAVSEDGVTWTKQAPATRPPALSGERLPCAGIALVLPVRAFPAHHPAQRGSGARKARKASPGCGA